HGGCRAWEGRPPLHGDAAGRLSCPTRRAGPRGWLDRRRDVILPDMRVIEISSFGEPDVLQLAEREPPVPAAGEVLIEVAAAGVNRPDLFQRQGRYPPPAGASDVPGLEVAGTVVAIG